MAPDFSQRTRRQVDRWTDKVTSTTASSRRIRHECSVVEKPQASRSVMAPLQ